MKVYLFPRKDRHDNFAKGFTQVVVPYDRTSRDHRVGRVNVRSAYKAMRRGGTNETGARILIWALTNNGINIMNERYQRHGR